MNEPKDKATGTPRACHCYVADLLWVYEDRLAELPRPPSEQEYKELFASSRVIDGVRMFPAVRIDGVMHLIRSDAEIVQHTQADDPHNTQNYRVAAGESQ